MSINRENIFDHSILLILFLETHPFECFIDLQTYAFQFLKTRKMPKVEIL